MTSHEITTDEPCEKCRGKAGFLVAQERDDRAKIPQRLILCGRCMEKVFQKIALAGTYGHEEPGAF